MPLVASFVARVKTVLIKIEAIVSLPTSNKKFVQTVGSEVLLEDVSDRVWW